MIRTLACSLVLLGCAGGSETGNPAVPTPIALGLHSSNPEAVSISSGTAGTVIDEAWVSIGEIQYFDRDRCGQVEGFDDPVDTLLVADLADTVDLELDVPDGTCSFVIPLQRFTDNLPDDAPTELADHSVVLKGVRGDGTPFVLMHPERDELELIATDGEIPVGAERLLLFFDVARWMEDVNLEDSELDEDGVIRIDAASNSNQWRQFEDVNLECSMEMFLDANDDGMLDEDDPRVGTCPDN